MFVSGKHIASRAFRALTMGCLLTSAALVVGCAPDGGGPKSFFDPSELGYRGKAPLPVDILDRLEGIDEPSSEFATAVDPTPMDLEVSHDDYKVGRGDLVAVSVYDLVAAGIETVKQVRVTESGSISLPYVPSIKALGLTEAELQVAIADAYRQNQIIQNPQVSVTIIEARARTFSMLGAVAAPGQYAILKSDFRVLDALVLARDVTSPSEYLYIVRQTAGTAPTETPVKPATPDSDVLTPRTEATPAQRVVLLDGGEAGEKPAEGQVVVDGKVMEMSPATVPAAAPADDAGMAPAAADAVTEPAGETTEPFAFNELKVPAGTKIIRVPLAELKSGKLQYNVVVRADDLLIVPQPEPSEYYMGGHVARVGVYSLTGRKITLKQAIVSAGMLDGIAIPSRTEITRRVGPNKEVTVHVDLEKIFNGEQADIYLKPNDVVNVGTNALAPFLAAVRGGFRLTYGFGFLYDRNYWENGSNN